jgi:hypothetical protein
MRNSHVVRHLCVTRTRTRSQTRSDLAVRDSDSDSDSNSRVGDSTTSLIMIALCFFASQRKKANY